MSNAINMFFFDSCTWNPHLFDESSLSFPDLADSLTAPAEGYGLGGSLWTVECHGLRVTAGAAAVTADVKVREPCGGLVGWFLQKLDKNIGSNMFCFDLLGETSQCFLIPSPKVHILIIPPQRCSVEALTTADALVLLGGQCPLEVDGFSTILTTNLRLSNMFAVLHHWPVASFPLWIASFPIPCAM